MVIMMENESQSELIGNPDAPNTNALAQQYGVAMESYAFGHPSLPNYLELLAGSAFGVTTDDTPSSVNISASAPTLVNQFESAGIPWRAYFEDMPAAGYTGGDSGGMIPMVGTIISSTTIRSSTFPRSRPRGLQLQCGAIVHNFTTDLDSGQSAFIRLGDTQRCR